MKNLKNLILTICIITSFVLTSCEDKLSVKPSLSQAYPNVIKVEANNEDFIPQDDDMILGEKLKNPYSVRNMKVAYESIKSKYQQYDEVNIEDIDIKQHITT